VELVERDREIFLLSNIELPLLNNDVREHNNMDHTETEYKSLSELAYDMAQTKDFT
jgi:hypothetical protein